MEPVVINDTVSNNKGGMLKKIKMILLILIGIAVLFLAACIAIKSYNHSKYQDEFYVQQEALEYMQERYNEEFIVMYNRGMGGAYNYVQLYAYPVTHRDEMHKIEIQGYYNKWGKLDFYDDYVVVRLTEEYEAYVGEIINIYYKDYKFFVEFHGEWITNNLTSNTELNDLWKLKPNVDYPLPVIYIYLSPREESNNKDKLNEFLNTLQEKKYRGRVDLWYTKAQDKFELAERNNWSDIMRYTDYDDMVTYFIYSDEIKGMENK